MRNSTKNSARLRQAKREFPGCNKLVRSSPLLVTVAAAMVVVSSMFIIENSSEIKSPLDFALSNSKISLMMRGRSIPKRPEPLTAEAKYTWTIQNEEGSQQVQSSKTTPLKDVLESTCDPVSNTLNLQKNFTICVNGTLPPFQHKLPLFVPDTDDYDIFMLQPENINALQPDWVDWSWQTCFILRPPTDILTARIVGIQSNYFQHFHDNAMALIYQSRQGLDAVQSASRCKFEERILYETPSRGSKILHQEWTRLGFDKSSLYPTSKFKQVVGMAVVRKRYPRDADQVRMHPVHVNWFRSVLPPPTKRKSNKKVMWISRLGAQAVGIFARQCSNEQEVVQHLRQHVHNKNLVVYNQSRLTSTSLEELVNMFGDACAIVGIHGGGLYNQFFANDHTAMIELFPVNDRGLIHGQVNANTHPQLAHRAIWHNSNLLGQPYWRIHFRTDNAKEFAIDTKTMETVARALSLSGCA